MSWYIKNLSQNLKQMSNNEKITIKRNTSCCFRDEYKKKYQKDFKKNLI